VVDDEAHERRCGCTSTASKIKSYAADDQHGLDHGWAISRDGRYAAAVTGRVALSVRPKIPPVSVLHNLTDGTGKLFLRKAAFAARFIWAPDIPDFMQRRLIRLIHDLSRRALSCFISTT